jgi:serine/threonine protein kinase
MADEKIGRPNTLPVPTLPWHRMYARMREKHPQRPFVGRQGRLEEVEVIYMNSSNRIVTRVRDSITQRTFVLKKVVTPCAMGLTPEECLHRGSKELHEVKAMLDLDHPNTVRVYEAWLDVEMPGARSPWFEQWMELQVKLGEGGYVHHFTTRVNGPSESALQNDLRNCIFTVLYILMEDCQKGSLETLLKPNDKGLSNNPVVLHKLLVQCASAFAFLARNERVHKDVKTLNIFVSTGLNAKVGDFGSAEVLVHGTTPAIGDMTELFIAPEFFHGAQHINEKFDVFALGLVFLRLASGSQLQVKTARGYFGFGRAMAAFPKLTLGDMDEYLQQQTPIAAIIRRMLDPNPATRWSAEEVFNRLVLYRPTTILAKSEAEFPAPDATEDYELTYRLSEGSEEGSGARILHCGCGAVWRTMLGYALFGGLVYLLYLVTRDAIEGGLDTNDLGYDFSRARSVIGFSFGGAIVLSALWVGLVRIYHKVPYLVYYSIYLLVVVGCVAAVLFFHREDQIEYQIGFGIYGAYKLLFLLIGYDVRLFALQLEMSVHVSRDLVFLHFVRGKRLIIVGILVAILQLVVCGFAMIYFLRDLSLQRTVSLLPFLWFLAILRNIVHFSAAFVFRNDVLPTQDAYRHGVRVAVLKAVTETLPSIMLASFFTFMGPLWVGLLRLATVMFLLAKVFGCFCCYKQGESETFSRRSSAANGVDRLDSERSARKPIASSPQAAPPPPAAAPPAPAPAPPPPPPRPGSAAQAAAASPAISPHAAGAASGNNADPENSDVSRNSSAVVYGAQVPLRLCCMHVLCTYPARFLERLVGWLAKRCLKLIVTVMGYYRMGYCESYAWVSRHASQDALVYLQFDEVLGNFLNLCCVLTGFGGIALAYHYEPPAAFFGFVVAYSTARVLLEIFSAAITSSWIAAMSGELDDSRFDRLLHDNNMAIHRMMKIRRRG